MFPMTVTIQNQNQLAAVMAVLCADTAQETPTAKTAAKVQQTKKGTSEPESAEAVAGNDQPAAVAQTVAEAATDTTAQSVETGDAPTYQDTADAVTKLARVKGRDAAIAVLAKFGATKLPDVKPEQFAAVIAACEKAGA